MKKRVLFAMEWYDPDFHWGVANYARHNNWQLQAASPNAGMLFQHWRGDGIICMLGHDITYPLTQFVDGFQVAKVELTKFPFCKDSLAVYEDNEMMGRLAGKLFLERGFQHFLFIAEEGGWQINARYAAFRSVLQDVGLDSDIECLCEHTKEPNEFISVIANILKVSPKPIAVFTGFDSVAEWTVQACLLVGLRVPEDVAVLGTANQELICQFAEVPISSVDSNRKGWAWSAAEALDQMMAGKPQLSPIIVPPIGVVERASTDVLAVNDPAVYKAVEFIRHHFCDNIGVEDVVEAAGIPRSTLALKFKSALGKGINQQINSLRIGKAQRLLAETNLNTIDISKSVGFRSPYYFYRVFHKVCGLTAGTYRKQLGK